MKLAELRRELEDSHASRQRSSRLDQWRKLTAEAATKHQAQIAIPDSLESLGLSIYLKVNVLGSIVIF